MIAIPHALRELTQRLRTDVEKANANNWELLHKTAWDYVQALRTYVNSQAAINEPCIKVLAACRVYTHELRVSGEARSTNNKAVEEAKQAALTTIDHLEQALHDAEPSDAAGY